ncbi:hypothetical protein [Ramlibacter alkalitolerans]|jgi:hypothetical protein|uniref:Uncharacterized protein n=1 Tax=Ramlibacter alkalitolerans TaxID=2039631 RepID=A0ABS1JRD6_9BURK|nr:hypothetical protein [Ramlibacter alkalitolerans]MBL0426834.1 hypothetical protein [Ramlibacter alkalitolerans]
MTNTLLWTALYVFIALVVLAVVVRAAKRLSRRDEGRRPYRGRRRE